ncbi:hypothetical protein SUGI_0744920 [Cryptomeria japonica]|uniref:jasmonoyl--L-amino acid synthetase JAR4 n=1 Tax=Cryptomeria japonica TaxID=3369 RepID=UPI002414C6B9|nr:jasmonoyl--L-amino acid synthetase JAR4 [Cryptomeria japonica]GLJ36869.1 hypothetical protein SUGI_0744920 [Cryptomeria japonica]
MPEMPMVNLNLGHSQVIEEFEAITRDAERVQRETLKEILERNSSTEYLSKWGVNGSTDPQQFKAQVPLSTFADIKPYIVRLTEGEQSPLLTTQPISVFSLSSGTTDGLAKFLPFNDDLLETTVQIFRISAAYRARLFPLRPGARALEFVYGSKQIQTKGGFKSCTATSHVFRSELYKKWKESIQVFPCSPDEVVFGNDSQQSLYCHLLCGLLYSNEVQYVQSTFAYSIVDALRTLEHVWQELCSDIKEGKLSERITVPSMRAAVSKLLKPNPDLADEIYEKCKHNQNWQGIIPQLWPGAKYIYAIMTGSMELYLRKLRHYAGNLPLLSADYGATEGWIAANIDPTTSPENTTFTAVPNFAYFEFIPLHVHLEEWKLDQSVATAHYTESEPVGLTEVKDGQDYEVVVTTFGGLYRYRLGDIVRITGFYNSTPQLSYLCRKNLLLTLNIDKTTEKDLQIAVEKAIRLIKEENVELVDFTSYADMSTEPGHYVIFWELNEKINESVLNRCCSIMDESLIDPGYVGSRKANTIGPLELRIVEKGAFRKILDHYLSLGAAASQFKTPRCVNSNQALFDILNSCVIQTHFSTFLS